MYFQKNIMFFNRSNVFASPQKSPPATPMSLPFATPFWECVCAWGAYGFVCYVACFAKGAATPLPHFPPLPLRPSQSVTVSAVNRLLTFFSLYFPFAERDSTTFPAEREGRSVVWAMFCWPFFCLLLKSANLLVYVWALCVAVCVFAKERGELGGKAEKRAHVCGKLISVSFFGLIRPN